MPPDQSNQHRQLDTFPDDLAPQRKRGRQLLTDVSQLNGIRDPADVFHTTHYKILDRWGHDVIITRDLLDAVSRRYREVFIAKGDIPAVPEAVDIAVEEGAENLFVEYESEDSAVEMTTRHLVREKFRDAVGRALLFLVGDSLGQIAADSPVVSGMEVIVPPSDVKGGIQVEK